MRLRARLTALVSSANQQIEPMPTPASSAIERAVVFAASAVDAAAKTAPHDRIVVGFEAVAASDVTNARHGFATSSSASPPRRTRNADHSVRIPIHARTAA